MTVEEILRRKIEEMEKTISCLTKQNEEYKILIKSSGLKDAEKDYNERFADFFNAVLFDGREVIQRND